MTAGAPSLLAFASVPPPPPRATRRASELSITFLATSLAALLVLLIALTAVRLLRRRAFVDTRPGPTGRPARLPDPWRESARRLERTNPTGNGPDSPRASDEEPFQ